MNIINRFIFVSLSCIIAIFYLNVPIYLDSILMHSVTLFLQVLLFSLVFIYGLMNIRKIGFPYSSIFVYFILMLVSYIYYIDLPDDYGWQGFHGFYLMFVFMVSFIIFFGISLNKKYSVLRIFVYVTVIAVLANYLDFFGKGLFFIKPDAFGVRAAGFFVDPNVAASGILLSMCLSIYMIPMKWRILYVYFCFSGVLLTFSRGGMLVWVVIYIYWLFVGTISRRLGLIALFALVFFSGSVALFFDTVSDFVDISSLQNRISFFSGDQVSQNISDDSRGELAQEAFRLFMSHPILGNGSMSLLRAGLNQQSHNQYLAMLSDYGILGLILYLLFLYTIFVGKRLFSTVLLFVLLWGIFAHTVLDSYVFMIAFSLVCIYPATREYRSFKSPLKV